MNEDPETAARRASELAPSALSDLLGPADGVVGGKARSFHVTRKVWTAPELTEVMKDSLWELYDTNMNKLASGTSLETPKDEKMAELFDPATRYIAYLETETSGEPSVERLPLLGFASIRFDTEDTLESQEYEDARRTTVVYIYEMQVASHARGLGLGKRLLQDCEALARGTRMQKTMLTCLKANERGLQFYKHNGYVPDEIDPTSLIQQEQARRRRGEIDWAEGRKADTRGTVHIDYRILSKRPA